MSDPIGSYITGRVFEIQRFSIHDGPGIRTTVFLKGCPLQCAWCHNPEGMDPGKRLSFQPEKCIGCGFCFDACPRDAHRMVDGRHVLDRDRCEDCGTCAEECWAQALESVGGERTVRDVIDEAIRDRPFYDASGGGLTLSGGEPMVQIEFALALLEAAGNEGLHRCMETCGAVPAEALEKAIPMVDLFLFDIKDTSNSHHLKHTGSPNTRILANLRFLHDRGAMVRLRLPIVPGFNDRQDHFAGIASLVRTLPDLQGVEIMPYHPLGLDKDERFALPRRVGLPDSPADQSVLRDWIDQLEALGVQVTNAA